MRKLFYLLSALVISASVMAEDQVMAATKSAGQNDAPKVLSLSLKEAQD